jgi:hypothetical protein
MPRALWQLLLEDPSDLTCDECFALMEYYAEALTRGGVGLLPEIIEHLERCPDCELQHRQALHRLVADESERGASPLAGATGHEGSKAKV